MQTAAHIDLQNFVLAEWRRDIPKEAEQAAKSIAERFGAAACGVMFYGSSLRTHDVKNTLLDFYVIVTSYKEAYGSSLLAVANHILPPNVFYHEVEVDGVVVRSKYAVLSLCDMEARVTDRCLNASVWARFSQPCMFLHACDAAMEERVAGYVATATVTMLGMILSLKPDANSSRKAWVAAFDETYASELRSEREGKGLEIYLYDQCRYDAITPLVFAGLKADTEKDNRNFMRWLSPNLKKIARRFNGKLVSFLRLVKASMTFDGGMDYLAWKIKRHSGIDIEIKAWMRRFPISAGLFLFVKLRKTGAFK